jgi:hypothetical protein
MTKSIQEPKDQNKKLQTQMALQLLRKRRAEYGLRTNTPKEKETPKAQL